MKIEDHLQEELKAESGLKKTRFKARDIHFTVHIRVESSHDMTTVVGNGQITEALFLSRQGEVSQSIEFIERLSKTSFRIHLECSVALRYFIVSHIL